MREGEVKQNCRTYERYKCKCKMNITMNIMAKLEYFLLELRDKIGIPFKPEKEI